MKTLSFLAALLLLCAACKSSFNQSQIASALGPEKQYFTINIGQDTVVRCKGGMVLHFCPNTFICSEKKFTLEVREVRDRGEAFLLGMGTLSSDGRLLETEGMVYLDATTPNGEKVSINPDCPITLELPVKGRRAGAKWFKGNVDKGVNWAEIPGGLVNQTDVSNLENGKELFKTLCASCHNRNLCEPLTGPALGNITQFREKEWLRRFTRNSQGMMGPSDTISDWLANCLWSKWKPTMMSAFPQLSDNQIDAIYQFIEEESARLELTLDSSDYACVPVKIQVEQPGIHSSGPDVPDTFSLPAVYTQKAFNPYFAKISSMGWHNCDLYVNDSTAIRATVKVKVPTPEQYDEILAGMLFDEFNSNIELQDYGEGQFETVRDWDVRLPQKPARIVIIGLKGKSWFKFEQPFTVGANNEFTATLQSLSSKEMDKFIQSAEFKQPVVETAKRKCLQSQ